MHIRSLEGRIVGLATLGASLWAVVAFWVMPKIVRDAYAGQSIPLLNRMIAGRDQFPVETYLEAWATMAWLGLAALVTLTAGSLVVARHRERIAATVGAIWRASLDAEVPKKQALYLTLCVGGFAGVIEAAIAFGRQASGEPAPPWSYPIEAMWLAPIVTASALVVLVLLPMCALRRGTGLLPLRLLVGLLVGIAAFGAMESGRFGLHPLSVALLAVGLATAASRAAAAAAGSLPTLLPRTLTVLACAVLMTALGVRTADRLAERLHRAGLPEAPSGKPNVLIVIWDTVRAHNLSLYGYDRLTTPHLDSFAERGVVFERAIATAPWTLPSHASILTGEYRHRLSVGWGEPLDDAHPTLAETLSAVGYDTGGFVGNFFYAGQATGLARGFGRYEDHRLSLAAVIGSVWLLREPAIGLLALVGDHQDYSRWRASDINASFLRWLDADDEERPFFAMINYFDAHDPYLPPEPFNLRFATTQPRYWPTGEVREDALVELTAAYDGSVAYVDHEFGDLIRSLEARGVLDNTLVVVTSDHGEHFGEHDPMFTTHGHSLYDAEIHVPLVLSLPGQLPEGVRVQDPVTLRDIAATVLDVVEGGPSEDLPGSSLRTTWVGSGPAVSPVLSEARPNGYSPEWAPVAKGQLRSIYVDRRHYIMNGDGSDELYDFMADPWERNDLSDDEPTKALWMRRALDRALNDDPDGGREAR